MMDMNKLQADAVALGYFDFHYYLDQTGLNFENSALAFEHYDKSGWIKNFNPSAGFDTRYYLSHNPDVRIARLNPLLHYLKHGRLEGRSPRVGKGLLSSKPRAPDADAWVKCKNTIIEEMSDLSSSAVDVIIPVYRGYDDTLACIYSVLTSKNTTPFRLVVIDDQSPDEKLSEYLKQLADYGLITLIRNEKNLGFVGSVNLGMQLSQNNDVCLLNSDTIVYHDWLDRLRFHAKVNSKIGTVTPFSNNATILSYPRFLENNNTDLEIDYSDLDIIFAGANKEKSSDVITGVGFCFYINRECLDDIGYFDEKLFGRGYGEENDFCRRADKAGWRNLGAWDIFVQHTGEISFSESAAESKRVGYANLLSVHPEYDREVQEFIVEDSLRQARESVDIERARRISSGRGILFIEHGRGGGTTRHIHDLVRELNRGGSPVFIAHPGKDNSMQFAGLGKLDFPNIPSISMAANSEIVDFIERLGIKFVHLHSAVDFDLNHLSKLCAAMKARSIEYYYTAHDYASVCPKITMTDWSGVYCSSEAEAYCNSCLEKSGGFEGVNIRKWRSEYNNILASARRVIVPHADVAKRISRYLPKLTNIIVRRHFSSVSAPPSPVLAKNEHIHSVRKIGIVGAIGPHKGSSLLLRMAADASIRELQVEYTLYGECDRNELKLFDKNFRITGRYLENEIQKTLATDRPDIIFLPSVWPETHCYTLDVAFDAGIMPVVFDIGAQAARVREIGFGSIIPLSYSLDPSKVNEVLINISPNRPVNTSLNYRNGWVSESEYYDR